MQGLSYGVIRVDSEERLSVLTVQDVGTVMPGGTHASKHRYSTQWCMRTLNLIKGQSNKTSMCVFLCWLLHKVCNVFIDVVSSQVSCVWSNQREFLSCAEQMRSESCACVPSPRECRITGCRAWQKTPLRFVFYHTEIDSAKVNCNHLPRILQASARTDAKGSDHQSLWHWLWGKLR